MKKICIVILSIIFSTSLFSQDNKIEIKDKKPDNKIEVKRKHPKKHRHEKLKVRIKDNKPDKEEKKKDIELKD